ncbi:MAG: PIN domain-containing protein [Candidatus Micrarchaeota archaeon]
MSAVIDTSVLVAFHNSGDERHADARRLMERAGKGEFGRLLLPEYVFDEAVTLALARSGKENALRLGEWLLNSGFEFVPSDDAAFKAAWALFAKSSELSFTDCFIVAVAASRGAKMVSFDRHFRGVRGLALVP